LNPDGILFLGNSESIGANRDLFVALDRKCKIYQRKETVTQHHVPARTRTSFTPQQVDLPEPEAGFKRFKGLGLRERMEKTLLDFHTPACVIIDLKHTILYIHGRTGKYLEPVAGEATSNIVRMAREGLKTELVAALHDVITRKETVRREGIQVKTNGDYQAINLTVRLLEEPPAVPDLIMVIFEETQTSPNEALLNPSDGKPKNAGFAANRRVAQLEKTLMEKDEYLHAVINELEETNQDLKATNEELQATNEEMQSANEELETSREELQSINEELSTINAELQSKNEELGKINNDIYNLLASTEIATMFLDLDLRLRRFTPAIQRIYNFLPTDLGRPIAHIVSNLAYERLTEDIREVLYNLVPKAIEVQAKDDAWYLINIKPYRTLERVIDGAVVTFVDITEQKRGDVLRRLGTILHDSSDAITMQDFDGKILAWNRGAEQMFGWTEAEALKMNALDLVPKTQSAEFRSLYQRLSKGEIVPPFETQKLSRGGRTLNVWMTLTAQFNDAKQPVSIATTERDITDRKQPERQDE
jgi:two-component system CheB/CheR fusion protein